MPTCWPNGFTGRFFPGHDWQQTQGAHDPRRVYQENIATKEELFRVHCPVGLPIGAVGIHEIAVNVLAEFIQIRAAHFGILKPPPAVAIPAEPPPRAS